MVRAARRGPRPRRRRGRARRRGERRSRRDRRHLLCDGDDELRRVARSDVYRSRSLGRPRGFRKPGLGGSHHLNRPIVRRGRRGQALHRVNEVEASVGRDLRVGRFDEVEHALPGSSADGAVANMSVYVLARQANELGRQSVVMRFLEKPIGAHDVETHGAREGLPQGAAEVISRPCLASRRRRRHFPAILVPTSENKVCGRSLDGRNGRGSVRFCLAGLFLFAHVRLLWMRSWRCVQEPICPRAFVFDEHQSGCLTGIKPRWGRWRYDCGLRRLPDGPSRLRRRPLPAKASSRSRA
ncbi:hypothetical protein RHE_PD00019 (plasmid) [Rhizobium etli CFN 42]|uniref:Uncharacterized protein n=1 Tax=Rhizobium etli (strain ATCC 51251 / DSM 11541 / JCM 21823 / NBRC 15573 / CFN 42) TaxID=347834 RepID=Q8KKU8_RHIEC|nr:hypothetical protein RHE_PD00019 [Rhizobium etli CFN 42]